MNCKLLRFGSDHPWGQRKDPPGDLSCAQGSLWSSCSVRRTRLMEETWRCQGVEGGDGTQSQACILRLFPQYPFSPLSRPTQFLRAAFSLPHGFFSPVSPLFRREPRSPACQPRMASLRDKKGSSPQITCLQPQCWERRHLHWESCPGCKALQHRAGVGSPRQRGPGTHPSAGRFEPPQGVWPDVACYHQFPWAPRHLYGSNALGSCSHSR